MRLLLTLTAEAITIPATSVNPGDQLGHYSVVEKIGVGGMGEVYRATDTKLGRDVAIKVLPAALAGDADRMARFQREAQVLASLNHPHIATIFGLEQSDSQHALVMELVEGPTLADRIQQGPIPAEDALPLARQIAEALEYAHDRGIIHRDLKPANIKLTGHGAVKVLDFGLAKALSSDPAASDISASPTLSFAATQAGIILGTAAYMAPEQARGKTVDRRADIWSFGAVLYEMLSGKRAFTGEDASEILATVIKSDPDWDVVPAETPPQIRRLLRRCLEKDPRRRLQAIGEARIQIEEVLSDPLASTAVMSAATTSTEPAWRRVLPWALAGVLGVGLAIAIALFPRTPVAADPPPARFELDMGALILARAGAGGTYLALSPDGQDIVVTARAAAGSPPQLYWRRMENLAFVPLPGTENCSHPFFSPDSRWVGFIAGGKLKKVALAGGVPITLTDLPNAAGSPTWGATGSIVFHAAGEGSSPKLYRIPEGGGVPEALTLPEGAVPSWPHFLPGGRALLYVSRARAFLGEKPSIEVLSLETGEHRTVVEDGSWPRYVSTGHVLYAQYDEQESGYSGGVLAVPFDLDRLERTGSPVPLLEGVRVGSGGAGNYEVAENGTLVFLPGGSSSADWSLNWVGSGGKIETLPVPPRRIGDLALSPDGTLAAIGLNETNSDIHVLDLQRNTLQRLTFEGSSGSPLFSPDGKRIVYASTAGGRIENLWWKPADGSGEPERLTTSDKNQSPSSFSPDGKFLLFQEGQRSNRDVYVLPLEGDRKPVAFLKTPASEGSAQFSPDGKWVTYTSDANGTINEVYVQPYPGPGGRVQISQGGGGRPMWSRDGRKLYYFARGRGVRGTAIMVVDVSTQPAFRAGAPQVFADVANLPRFSGRGDLSADGRFLLPLLQQSEQEGASLNKAYVVFNFTTEIRRRAPAPK